MSAAATLDRMAAWLEAVTEARDCRIALAVAERACRDIPLILPPWRYRKRLDAAMQQWNQANLALFDAEIRLADGWPPR